MPDVVKLPLYTCKECGLAVIVRDGNIIRACGHDTAGVFGNIGAVAYGVSTLTKKGYTDIPTPEEVKARGV